MSPSPEQVIAGHRAALAQVRSRVSAYAQTAWKAQGNYRDADIDRLVSLIVPRVKAGQVQTANLTSSYIATMQSAQTGKLVTPTPVDVKAVTLGRGVDLEEVYRRPGRAIYVALADGKQFSDAVQIGSTVLSELVPMDLQMAQVRQSFMSYNATGVKRFRRVTSGGSKVCDLCLAASEQVYSTDDLMPIHDRCACGTEPLADGETPPPTTRPEDAPDVSVAVHGEHGPTLVYADQNFSGISAIDSVQSTERLKSLLAALERNDARLSTPYVRARINGMRSELASRQ